MWTQISFRRRQAGLVRRVAMLLDTRLLWQSTGSLRQEMGLMS
jgi:hypothetical protein